MNNVALYLKTDFETNESHAELWNTACCIVMGTGFFIALFSDRMTATNEKQKLKHCCQFEVTLYSTSDSNNVKYTCPWSVR